jgi:short-subunit dehydrogenase
LYFKFEAASNILLNLGRDLKRGKELNSVKRDLHDEKLRTAAAESIFIISEASKVATQMLYNFSAVKLGAQAWIESLKDERTGAAVCVLC